MPQILSGLSFHSGGPGTEKLCQMFTEAAPEFADTSSVANICPNIVSWLQKLTVKDHSIQRSAVSRPGQYSSQMTPQTLQRESVAKSSRGPVLGALKPCLLFPVTTSALRAYGVGFAIVLDHHRWAKWGIHRGLPKYMGELTVENNLTRWEERGEQHTGAADTLAYLISWDSWKSCCRELGTDTAALLTVGLTALRIGGIKGCPKDPFFISPPLEYSKEAWKE